MLRRTGQSTLPIVVFQAMVAIGANCALFSKAFAADRIVVHLRDGGHLSGEIDGRSSADHLWLRFEADSTVMLRPIWAERIVGLTVGNRSLIGNAITDYLAQIRSQRNSTRGPSIAHAAGSSALRTIQPAPVTDVNTQLGAQARAPGELPMPRVSSPAVGRAGGTLARRIWPTDAEEALRALGFRMPVKSVSAFAQVTDWNEDGSPDGLELRVIPRDGDGQCVAVDGTLEIEAFHVDAPSTGSHERHRLARWIQPIERSHVSAHGASYRLNFANDIVQRRFLASGPCTVAVQLTVPGQRVLQVSITPGRAQSRPAPSR